MILKIDLREVEAGWLMGFLGTEASTWLPYVFRTTLDRLPERDDSLVRLRSTKSNPNGLHQVTLEVVDRWRLHVTEPDHASVIGAIGTKGVREARGVFHDPMPYYCKELGDGSIYEVRTPRLLVDNIFAAMNFGRIEGPYPAPNDGGTIPAFDPPGEQSRR